MLSLGGAIGTGLFLGSGKSFHKLDLLAQLLPIFLGCNCYMVMLCLGELAVHMPFRVLSVHTLESTLVQVQAT